MARKQTQVSVARRVTSEFEKKTTRTLREQNRVLAQQNDVLAQLQDRLDAPILNGGYNDLVQEVGEIKSIKSQLESASVKIDHINASINDPDHGIYVKVKHHDVWIMKVNSTWKWVLGTVGGLLIAGGGKILFDYIVQHFH